MVTAKKAADSLVKTKRALSTPKKIASKKTAVKRAVKTTTRKSSGSLPIKNNTNKITATEKTVRTVQRSSVKTVHTPKAQVPALRAQSSLAVLSPYRFPIDSNTIAVGTARFGGVFFVLVGAIFTLLFSNNVFSNQSLVASTISTYTNTQITTEGGTALTTSVNTKPQADFIVNNPAEVRGTAQIKVIVPHASRVTLMAFFKTQEREVTLGSPTKVSDDTWEMNVDTRTYDDGEYMLKALIVNQYGTYESVDDSFIRFVNSNKTNEEKTTQTTTALITAVSATSSTGSDAAQAVLPLSEGSALLTADKKESSSELRFEVTTSGAQKVKIYAKDKTGARKLLGYAYASNSTTWKYRWNLSDVASGTYDVFADADGATDATSNTVTVQVLTTISSEIPSSTTLTTTATNTRTNTSAKPLTPEIRVGLDTHTPLSSIVNAKIEVEGAQSIEVFALPKNSLVQKYLGRARKVDDTVWLFAWDTNTIPNGEYSLFVYVKNAFGVYTKESPSYTVQNASVTAYTEEQQIAINKLAAVAKEEPKVPYVPALAPEPVKTPVEGADTVEQSPVGLPYGETPAHEGDVPVPFSDANELIKDYRETLEKEMQRLASALRMKDENAVFEIKERLNSLKRDIVAHHTNNRAESELVAVIDEYLAKTIERVEEDVARIEKVIVERTKLQAQADADADGISDYDEITLYTTNPYSADTDGDGFPDGAEILRGYDPLDAASEVLIAYESPKETGIVREDILTVDSVITATPNDAVAAKAPAAIISGKGLPNSFVTLYIFSTPIVITVKTDTEGNWIYRFDKELEDGEHQVYVGVTDNAGKIVAKSEPFTFVKEAQAFSGTAHTVPEVPTERAGSFASQYALYLVLSISVVAIGLVLILLGLYLDTRPRKITAAEKGTAGAV